MNIPCYLHMYRKKEIHVIKILAKVKLGQHGYG